MRPLRRATVAVLVLAIGWIAVLLLIPLYHATPPTEPPNIANDVARLNPTVVREAIPPKDEDEIRDAIMQAGASRAKITIAGKRHSMGGQTLYPGSIAIDMLRFNK